MISITGFEPLDLVIMNSHEKLIKTRDYMQKYRLSLDDALTRLGYDYEDFTGNDLKQLAALDRY